MLRFAKYHGCGNDFVILTEEEAGNGSYSELAKQVCHRQLGIGADGLIIVKQDPLEMIFYTVTEAVPPCVATESVLCEYCLMRESAPGKLIR